VAGTINNITPPGAIINGSYQAITGKDPVTGQPASRVDGVGNIVITGLFHLTVQHFVSPGIRTQTLERPVAENPTSTTSKQSTAATGSREGAASSTASRSLPKSKLDLPAGGEYLDDAIRTTEQPFLKPKTQSAKAYDLIRTETIGGDNSARTVAENIKLIRNHKQLAPVEVVNINNKLYVINGHHRLEAAIRTNTELRYVIVSKSRWKELGYKSESEITHAATETSKVKLDNKLINKLVEQK